MTFLVMTLWVGDLRLAPLVSVSVLTDPNEVVGPNTYDINLHLVLKIQ